MDVFIYYFFIYIRNIGQVKQKDLDFIVDCDNPLGYRA